MSIHQGVKIRQGYGRRKFYLPLTASSLLNEGVHQTSNAEAFSLALYI